MKQNVLQTRGDNMKFQELFEKYTIYKQVKREYYPKQISFSPEFIRALREEYSRQQVDENSNPINNKRDKFLKALNFHLRDIDNGTVMENMTQGERLKKEVNLQKKVTKKLPKSREIILKQNLGNK